MSSLDARLRALEQRHSPDRSADYAGARERLEAKLLSMAEPYTGPELTEEESDQIVMNLLIELRARIAELRAQAAEKRAQAVAISAQAAPHLDALERIEGTRPAFAQARSMGLHHEADHIDRSIEWLESRLEQ